jgi:hypothetical protein
MGEAIIFKAFLKDKGHPIKISNKGFAEVTFEIPKSSLGPALRLVLLGEATLDIAVKHEGKKDADFEAWLNK